MKRLSITCLSGCLVAWLVLPAHSVAWSAAAVDDELALAYGDSAMVSIATGHRQPLHQAPAVATVITAEEIAATGAVDLDEVLATVPGLHVSRAANNYHSLYLVRGVFSQLTPQTLVLQNGVPVTTLFQGNKGNLWGGYPVEHIARIEVIRGPGSALYGADAYSGVINVITKGAADIRGTETGVRAGTSGTWDAWLLHGGRLGPAAIAAYLRVGDTEGHERRVTADAQTRNDGLFGSDASLAPGHLNLGRKAVDGNVDVALGDWRLRAGYKLRDDLETAAGIAQALDPVGRGRSQRITADVGWNAAHFSPDWGAGAQIAYLHYMQQTPTDYQLFPPGVTFPTGSFPEGMRGGPDTWERQWRLSAFAIYKGWQAHRVRLGLGHDDLDLYRTRETRNFSYAPNGLPIPIGAVVDVSATDPFLRPHRRRLSYLYVQDEWNFARDWTLTAGLRHDHYSDVGDTTNPRLALVWNIDYNLTAKLLYGTAFRPPAFLESYSTSNPVNRGNPDLQPETVRTFEAALAWQPRPDTKVALNLFRYDMKDIIRPVPNAVPGTGSTYQNTGRQHGNGMEIELGWDASRSLRLSAHYAYQRSIDEATGKDAGHAPHHAAYARLDWRFAGRWLASAQVHHVADRHRAAGDDRPRVPDYTTLDFTARTTGTIPGWDVAMSVRNFFNADVREPSLAPGSIRQDLPMARRSFWVQASHRF